MRYRRPSSSGRCRPSTKVRKVTLLWAAAAFMFEQFGPNVAWRCFFGRKIHFWHLFCDKLYARWRSSTKKIQNIKLLYWSSLWRTFYRKQDAKNEFTVQKNSPIQIFIATERYLWPQEFFKITQYLRRLHKDMIFSNKWSPISIIFFSNISK